MDIMCPNGENQEYSENSHRPPNERTCLREDSNFPSLVHTMTATVCVLNRISQIFGNVPTKHRK